MSANRGGERAALAKGEACGEVLMGCERVCWAGAGQELGRCAPGRPRGKLGWVEKRGVGHGFSSFPFYLPISSSNSIPNQMNSNLNLNSL